jgi:hypothetical protein
VQEKKSGGSCVCSRRRVGVLVCINTILGVRCVCSSRRVGRVSFEVEGEWGVVCALEGDCWKCCVCIRRRMMSCVCSRRRLG